MSYPDTHVRITWGGSLYGAPNAWQNNLHIVNPPLGGEELILTDENFAMFVAPLLAWLNNEVSLSHKQVKTDYISMSLISRNGGVLDSLIMDFDDPHGVKHRGNVRMPNHVSLVLTLRATSGSTLARSGRIYLPAPNVEVQDDGKVLERVTKAVAESFAAILDSMNVEIQKVWPNAYLGLVSPIRAGSFGRIITVSCGDVLDTMISRKKFLQEIYTPSYVLEDSDPQGMEINDVWPDFDMALFDMLSDIIDSLTDNKTRVTKKTPIKFKK